MRSPFRSHSQPSRLAAGPDKAEKERRLGRALIGHLPALRRYALGLSGHGAQADDLVQDCIERALPRLAGLNDESRLLPWLRTVLFSVFVEEHRRWRSRVATAKPKTLDMMVDRSASPDVREELAETLRAMTALVPHHRQVLLLVGVEGLSYREAAEELGVPIGTVMSRLARARDDLREALEATVSTGGGRTS